MKKIFLAFKSFPNILSKKQNKEFLYIFFLSIIAMLFETLSIASVFPLLNVVFDGSSNIKDYLLFIDVKNLTNEKLLLILIIIFISIFIIKALILTYVSAKKYQFVFGIRTIQTNNLFRSYIKEDYLFHINNNSASLIRNLNDANLLSVFAISAVEFFAEIIMFIGIFTFLIFLSPKITISVTLFFCIVAVIFYKLVQSKALIWGEKEKLYRGEKLKNLKESFGAIRDIKILGKELNFLEIFKKSNSAENQYKRKNSFVADLPKIWFELLIVIVMVFMVIYLTGSVEENISIIPFLGVYALAAYRLVPSITRISNYVQNMNNALPAAEPYIANDSRIQNTIISDQKNSINKEEIKFSSEINLKDVDYTFPNTNEKILNNLNIKIKKGQTIGIHGSSGAGKTTLINIIMGLLKSDKGEILVDNQSIYKNLKNWQKIISYIPQNVFLLDDTIINNVALGEKKENIDMKSFENSLKVSRIFDFVYSLPKNINSNCGELGDKLSGGQKQRIGISRALYRNSDVLIFDEFTNFLDKQNEEEILEDIKNMSGKTKILISHNLKVFKYCDEVYELKNKTLIRTQL